MMEDYLVINDVKYYHEKSFEKLKTLAKNSQKDRNDNLELLRKLDYLEQDLKESHNHIDNLIIVIDTLNSEKEKLEKNLNEFKNKHIEALRWIVELTRKQEKEYNEPKTEKDDNLDDSCGCDCCGCLHRS